MQAIVSPLALLIAAGVFGVATIAGVVVCITTGNKDQVSTIVGIGLPVVMMLLGAIGVSSHSQNVTNQEKIARASGVNLDEKK